MEMLLNIHLPSVKIASFDFNKALTAIASLNAAADECYLLNLPGLGFHTASQESVLSLRKFLAGRPALFFHHKTQSQWYEEAYITSEAIYGLWQTIPYSGMDVLNQLKKLIKMPSASVQDAISEPKKEKIKSAVEHSSAVMPVWQRAMQLAEKESQAIAERAPEKSVTAGLTAYEGNKGMAEVISSTFPALQKSPFFTLLSTLISEGGAAKLLFSRGTIPLFIDIKHGWIATRMTLMALRKIIFSPAMMRDVVIDAFYPVDMEEAVKVEFGQRAYNRFPADILLWSLASDAVSQIDLQPSGDFYLFINQFPNFNYIEDHQAFHIQLASICARSPQKLSSLLKLFPENKEAVCQFAITSLVSGNAYAFKVASQQKNIRQDHEVKANQLVTAGRRGFFKNLLDKLF